SLAGTKHLAGIHLVDVMVDFRDAAGTRDGTQRLRFGFTPTDHASGSSTLLAGGLRDRWRPRTWLELDAGLRVETMSLHGSIQSTDTLPQTDMGFEPLISPRFGFRLLAPSGGFSGVFAAGRLMAPLPLEPLLDALGARSNSLTLPHEDVALAG